MFIFFKRFDSFTHVTNFQILRYCLDHLRSIVVLIESIINDCFICVIARRRLMNVLYDFDFEFLIFKYVYFVFDS